MDNFRSWSRSKTVKTTVEPRGHTTNTKIFRLGRILPAERCVITNRKDNNSEGERYEHRKQNNLDHRREPRHRPCIGCGNLKESRQAGVCGYAPALYSFRWPRYAPDF